jgi:hypothetical protein
LNSTDPARSATLVFETEAAAKLAAKIHAAVVPLQTKIGESVRTASAGVRRDDIPASLRQLAELRDQGIVTAEEFESKKTELLSRM